LGGRVGIRAKLGGFALDSITGAFAVFAKKRVGAA
jgi:hypothetical protein